MPLTSSCMGRSAMMHFPPCAKILDAAARPKPEAPPVISPTVLDNIKYFREVKFPEVGTGRRIILRGLDLLIQRSLAYA